MLGLAYGSSVPPVCIIVHERVPPTWPHFIRCFAGHPRGVHSSLGHSILVIACTWVATSRWGERVSAWSCRQERLGTGGQSSPPLGRNRSTLFLTVGIPHRNTPAVVC
ncbi:Hypothetical predicted protein, partial [Pelobates cultripes]